MKRIVGLVSMAVALWACGDDDGDDDGDDGGDAIDAGQPADAADEVDAGPDPADRGAYIVGAVAVCGDCHTPRLKTGAPDLTRLLGGNPAFADILPEVDGMGLVPTPNLTPDETGLGDWTDVEIKEAFLNGVDRDGEPLFAIMPYYVLHNMSEEDADAIVAYLRSIPAVDQEIPAREELGFPVTTADPVPEAMIPDSVLPASDEDYEAAQQGKYLAGNIGICMECHTAATKPGTPVPIDVDALFAGGRVFGRDELGLPKEFPEEIFSLNITPDPTGILGFTPEQVRTVLTQGTDDEGQGICPPMPVGPMGAFANLTEEDALAIGIYITTIDAVENAIKAKECTSSPPTLQ